MELKDPQVPQASMELKDPLDHQDRTAPKELWDLQDLADLLDLQVLTARQALQVYQETMELMDRLGHQVLMELMANQALPD